jgi:hypothetical protein
MALNLQPSKLFGTNFFTKAFPKISLWEGKIFKSYSIDICTGIFFNWLTILYWYARVVGDFEVLPLKTYLAWALVVAIKNACSCFPLILMTLIWFFVVFVSCLMSWTSLEVVMIVSLKWVSIEVNFCPFLVWILLTWILAVIMFLLSSFSTSLFWCP